MQTENDYDKQVFNDMPDSVLLRGQHLGGVC